MRGGSHDAIILPEYALDWATHDALVHHALDAWPGIEFIVSGVSVDCTGDEGNYVVFTTIQGSAGDRRAQTHSRRKHHRWCVDGSQIRGYGLKGELDPDTTWWEHLDVRQRLLQVEVFRSGSTFTAVICEDLARVDPGLAMIRDLGPNLVFALLMDGAQLRSRWPGVYATALADDPGSSVLTLTSMGLINRSNAIRKARGDVESRSIALWKSRPGRGRSAPWPPTEQIDLAPGAHAVVIELVSEPANETTMDGRPNSDTSAWYCDTSPVSVEILPADVDSNGWRWIADGPS